MIYFIRHGESEANADNLFSWPEAKITENGRLQAKSAGEKFDINNIIIDRIISSTCERAVDTAKIIAGVIDFDQAKIQYDHRLVEIDCGILSGKPRRDITNRQMLSVDGAEDVNKFQERVMKSFNEIKLLPGNTLVVSHAGVGCMINAMKIGMPAKNFVDVPEYPNARIEIIS